MKTVRQFLQEYAPIIRMYGLHPCRLNDMKLLMVVDDGFKEMLSWLNPAPEKKEDSKLQ